MSPRISVIVATHRRPALLVRAVLSALGQTQSDCEVIVVVDGPHAETETALASIENERLRVCVRPVTGGQPAAINTGVALARGEWIALLDDDDHWFPSKLERQLRAAEGSVYRDPIVACRFIARTDSGDAVYPRRIPGPAEPICEYLFCRHSLAFGEGILQTSTLLIPTAILRAMAMDESLPVHCDLDWLVKAARREGVGFEFPPGDDPLSVWEIQGGRDRLSHGQDWRYSWEWIRSVREYLTPRAYAGFLLTWISLTARRVRCWPAFFRLSREALFHGRPNLSELLVHLSIWLLPGDFRARLSRSFAIRGGRRPNPESACS